MSAKAILEIMNYVEAVGALLVFLFLYRSKELKTYWAFGGLLLHRGIGAIFLLTWLHFGKLWIGRKDAYSVYFYTYWGSFIIDSGLVALTIYSIYRTAMEPLKGLQSLGMLVFKWAAAISTVIALALSIGPRVDPTRFIALAAGEMQRASGILTLSLLLFVCFAIRPMGLTYRSRIFGITIGLGVTSTLALIAAAWQMRGANLYNYYDMVVSSTTLVVLCTWSVYFAVPEPKRRFILLPTTSPFLRWNHISELLGHNPGYVAIGGFSPENLAPAEMEVMRRASVAGNEKGLQVVAPAA